MENDKNKNKNFKLGKVYIWACVISFVIGIFSLIQVRNISRSALNIDNQTIKIPSYEEIIKENEELSQIKDLEKKEPEKKEVNLNTESVKTDVKPVNITPNETEKQESFTKPCQGEILKRFSIDKPIKSKTMGDFRTHNGIDIKCNIGDTVACVMDGEVTDIYSDNLLGLTIVVSHNEKIKTMYSNIAGDDMVKKGDLVKRGQAIGCVGDTAKGELLDDAHLHFSVLSEGKYVNPENYIDFKSKEE